MDGVSGSGEPDGVFPVCPPPRSHLDEGISVEYDSPSEANSFTTRLPHSSPASSISIARTCISSQKPALHGSVTPFSSPSLLSDLEISNKGRLAYSNEHSDDRCPSDLESTEIQHTQLSVLSLSKLEDISLHSNGPATQTAGDMHLAAFSHFATCEEAKQPWRKVWPPKPGSVDYLRILSRRPDVLSFSFDARNHLLHHNHPWQDWKAQQSDSIVMDDQITPAISQDPHHSREEDNTRQQRDELDDLIQVDLQLPYVIPACFNYLRPLRLYETERPYRLQLPPGLVPIPLSNVLTESYPVRIHDISGHDKHFTLDVSGFQFFKCPVSVGQWNDQAITESYLPALVDWVVALLGGTRGLVYSFNFRHHSSDSFVPVQRMPKAPSVSACAQATASNDHEAGVDDDGYCIKKFLSTPRSDDPFNTIAAVKADPLGPCHWKRPLFRVHCDASKNTHKHRLPIFLPDEAERLMKGRVRLISVWRALSTDIQDTPLALCDARTVDRDDLVPMDIVYPHFVDEVSEVRFNKSHRWFYKRGMGAEDVVIFKLHDTHLEDTVCPHSAFVDPTIPDDTPPRASIEVKMMIFGGEASKAEGEG